MTVAAMQISETNTSGATVTNNVTDVNLTAVDEINSDPAAAGRVIIAGNNSMEKWNRMRCNLINDSNKVDNFKHWITPSTPETGITYKTNCQEDPSLVNDSFPGGGPVDTISTYADQAAPTAEPSATNIGVSGGTGGLSADNTFTDYAVTQLQSTVAADPGDLLTKTFHYQWDEQ